MGETIVRILKLQIRNLKNVENGVISFTCNTKADIFEETSDILGVYGQNGSGKTTLIYALSLLKDILSGKSLPEDIVNYIKYGSEMAGCTFEFSVTNQETEFYRLIYDFDIAKHPEYQSQGFITREVLSYSKLEEGRWTKLSPIMCYDSVETAAFLPKTKLSEYIHGDKELSEEVKIAKRLSIANGQSYIFSNQALKNLSCSGLSPQIRYLILSMKEYGFYHLHILSNTQAGYINANIALPLSFVLYENTSYRSLLHGSLNLNGTSVISELYFTLIQKKIEAINLVLHEVIPGLQIQMRELSKTLSKDMEVMVSAELVSIRGEDEIPLRYESDGIKKLISVLSSLILVFNYPFVTLAVDEFDSGIFEYLLGELLKIVEESGKGQLIFTSHNLRPLEVIHKRNIIFTTTNEKNRYIRFKNVKTNNNFRDVYYHDLVLGGQNECIYENTNPYKITRAFRMAGEDDAE